MDAKTREIATYIVRIYVAGDLGSAKDHLRRACYPPNQGLCVTVEPTSFIYTGGEETGVVVGLVNYPRYPSTPTELFRRAVVLAKELIARLCQWSALVVASDRTLWITTRSETDQ